MRSRAVVIAGLVTAVAVSGTANAAGHKAKPKLKPVCNLVTDPAGDAPFDPVGTGLSQVPNDPNGDILSADLSSDAKNVTAVIRVKNIATPGTDYPLAHLYMLSWTVPGHDSPVYLSGVVDPNPAAGTVFGSQYVFGDGGTVGPGGALFYYNVGAKNVKGTIDTAKNTITLSVPISALKGYGNFAPGATFTGLEASTQALINGPLLPTNAPAVGGSVAWGFQEDVADGSKNYTAGAPSCVKPGS